MDLDDYLWTNRLTLGEFSKKCGIPPTTLSPIRKRKHPPSLQNAIIIVRASGGKIKYESLLTKENPLARKSA